jgi:KDO2-lipid IV(A) lauroyltransferase
MGRIVLPFFYLIGWSLFWMPHAMRVATGNALGSLLAALKMRRKVVRQNLALAFKDSSEKRARIERGFYRHFGNLILEILLLFGPMRKFASEETTIEGGENWKKAHTQGKGVFFLASHVGNWEIMSASGGVQLGMDLMLVTKHLKPEWLHQAIEKARARCGVRATYEPKTLRDVLAHLKKGGTVGFVLDQYAGPPVGVRVPVFGVPVGTTTAVAMLAKRTGAPVLPVLNYREPSGRYRVVIRPPLEWQEADPEIDIAVNTARYAALLEKDVLAHPEQWLWTHRRFKGNLGALREGEWAEGRARK